MKKVSPLTTCTKKRRSRNRGHQQDVIRTIGNYNIIHNIINYKGRLKSLTSQGYLITSLRMTLLITSYLNKTRTKITKQIPNTKSSLLTKILMNRFISKSTQITTGEVDQAVVFRVSRIV